MPNIEPKAAKIMTIVGTLDCITALVIILFILLGKSDLPIFIPALLLITGIMIIVVSLSFHTKK